MSSFAQKSTSSAAKSRTYVVLKKPTLLKSTPVAKQGKVIKMKSSGSVVAAKYAMAVYKKAYKQLSSVFLYRKGVVSRYSVKFKTNAGNKVASVKLTSRSLCKVTPGKPGKSRNCRAEKKKANARKASKARATRCKHKSLSVKKRSLTKAKAALKKAKKVLSTTKKRITKAKKALSKSTPGTKKCRAAKKKVSRVSKSAASRKARVVKLKLIVNKKTKALHVAHVYLHR